MSVFKTEADDPRQRYVPDVIVAENAHRQIRVHQFVGEGVEVQTWRRHYEFGWVRYKEALRLKRWESVALIRSLLAVMKEREGKRLAQDGAGEG